MSAQRQYFPNAVVQLVVATVAIFLNAYAYAVTLTVPFRGATDLQIGSVTIELDASSIDTAAQIVVEGVSLSVPPASCDPLTCTISGSLPEGDQVRLKRLAETERVRLILELYGSFGDPEAEEDDPEYLSYDFCGPREGLGERSFNIDLSGFEFENASNGYRITGLIPPTTDSCDTAYVRVPIPDLSGDPPLERLGRFPLNLVLVLDKSGSMSSDVPGATESRWARLKNSVQGLAMVWDFIGAPEGLEHYTETSDGHPEDRLGLVFFDHTFSEAMLDGSSFFKSRGTDTDPWFDAVTDAMDVPENSPDSNGWTSIGLGIAVGRARLNEVFHTAGDTAIVLFTDGQQNRSPCVVHEGDTVTPTTTPAGWSGWYGYGYGYGYGGYGYGYGSTVTDECTVVPGPATDPEVIVDGLDDLEDLEYLEYLEDLDGGLLVDLYPRGPIFTIGLGEGGTSVAAELLAEIAEETAGRSLFPMNGIEMDYGIIDQLVERLRGDTVSLSTRYIDELGSGAAATPALPVPLDGTVTRALFVLGWEGSESEGALDLEIRRQDDTIVKSALTQRSPNTVVVAVDLPSMGASGEWKARAIRSTTAGSDLRYHLSVYVLESRLSYRVKESPHLGTGRSFKIVAEVGWDGAGLEDLPPGSIRATFERPQKNLGNVLHDTVEIGSPPSIVKGETSDAPVDTSPLQAKLNWLIEHKNLIDVIEPRPLTGFVPLEHVGFGRYEAIFDDTIVGGRYRYRVDFEWDDPRTGRILRTEHVERQVPVLPSVEDSEVRLKRDAKSGDVEILITPRDGFGNIAGPGYGRYLRLQLADDGGTAKIMPPADPTLTGAYSIKIEGLSASADPHVKILFRGESLRDSPLSLVEKPVLYPQTESGSWGEPIWILVAIAVLVLIAAVIYWLRRGGGPTP